MNNPEDTYFLCGCHLASKLAFGYARTFVEGKEVCPEHGVREYGYKTTDAIELKRLNPPKQEGMS